MVSSALTTLLSFLFLPPAAMISHFYGARSGERAGFKGKTDSEVRGRTCLPQQEGLTSSLPHFNPKPRTWCLLVQPRMEIYWRRLHRPEPGPSCTQGVGCSFPNRGAWETVRDTFSAGAGDHNHAFSILLFTLERELQPRKGEIHFGCRRARALLAKLSETGQNKTRLSPLIVQNAISTAVLPRWLQAAVPTQGVCVGWMVRNGWHQLGSRL